MLQAARERARQFLREKRSFVWNATNLSRLVRGEVIRLLADYQARIRIVYLEVSEAEQRHRLEVRFATEPASTFELTYEELDKFRSLFDIPDQDELGSPRIDTPPAGYDTWGSWAAERWPSSMG